MDKNKWIILSVIAIAVLAGAGFWFLQSNKNNTEIPTETSSDFNSPTAGIDGCYIGGCSSEICSDQKGVISTCEYREEYACYKGAKCERQTSGKCGWTETSELNVCINAVLYPGSNMK